ncbi:DUF3408 domain-containing protein [Porphyromonas canoris]|uniref:Conjugal transfer protein TraC n=1 Tax=Porphyromonas canoris TaxID=36875 RepID=A0ABR4XMX4_9PORP|nr:DUF3408 domain-containing protein [Porphyromonas canoris]KGN92420.1 conjugal transfer protein TraC [Porphyromonas canoris]
MSSITEKRQKILSKKLQEMGDIGVSKRSAEESPFFDQPIKLGTEEAIEVVSPEEEDVLTAEPSVHRDMPIPTEEAPAQPAKRKTDATSCGLSFEEYEARFFVPSRDARGKVGFTIHWEVLQTLRDVLNDVRSRATLTSYIENIILEHLKEHQAMLNKVAAQHKRNPTINL